MDRKLLKKTEPEKIREYTRFAMHQMNNLISIVSGVPEIVLSKMSPPSAIKKMLQRIDQVAGQIASIHRQSILLANRNQMTFDAVSINEIIEIALAVVDIPDSIIINQKLDQNLPNIREMNRNCLTQLLICCMFFSEYSDEFTLETRRLLLKEKLRYHQTIPSGDYMEIVISSSLGKLTAEHESYLLDKFSLSKTKEHPDVLGFSLSVTSVIIDDHNGYLDFETTPKGGTAFHVLLPYVQTNTL